MISANESTVTPALSAMYASMAGAGAGTNAISQCVAFKSSPLLCAHTRISGPNIYPLFLRFLQAMKVKCMLTVTTAWTKRNGNSKINPFPSICIS